MTAVVIFSIAVSMAIVSAALLALAFGTDFWLIITVDLALTTLPGRASRVMANGPNIGRVYYSRHMGLWRECFIDRVNTSWILYSPSLQDSMTDGNCFAMDYQLQPPYSFNENYSDDYWAMIHLRRAVVASFICALVLLVGGSIVGAAGCWQSASRYAKFAGLVILLATAFASAGMAFWHGAEFVERNQIRAQDPRYLQRNWPDEIRRNVTLRYGWSYICAWIATIMAALSSAVYLLAALWIVRHKETHTYYPPKMYCLPPSYPGSFHGSGSYPGPYTAFPVEEYFYAKAPVSVNSIQRIISASNTLAKSGRSHPGTVTSSSMKSKTITNPFADSHKLNSQQTLDYIY